MNDFCTYWVADLQMIMTVENVFSNLRKKFPTPNALQFQQSLKLFVSQYKQEIKNTKRSRQQKTKISRQTLLGIPEIPDYIENKIIELDNNEKNAFYCICGYIIFKIYKYYKVCDECIYSAGFKKYNSSYKYSTFIYMRYYKPLTLFVVNNETFDYFYKMEIIICQYLSFLRSVNYDLVQIFTQKISNIKCDTLKNCHDLSHKIMI